ncbi:MAG: MOFRL family protein, partial [Ferroplasma sp.]
VKNGKLAKMLYPATVVSYIISDVIYNDLNVIASGPLAMPQYDSALNEEIEMYIKTPELKKLISEHVENIPGNEKYFSRISYNIILKNLDFVEYIYSKIDDEKINLGSDINGDVVQVADAIVSAIRSIYRLKNHGFWFVAGGETTVNVTGKGIGGRNEELVLRMLRLMENEEFLFASIGTDGIDGLSPAAGGIVDNMTSIDGIDSYLNNNDSYHALLEHNGLIITGRTGNNVSDIIMGYYSGERATIK